MTFLAQTNSQDNKQSTINSHLSDNLYNPIATPLGVQTGPLGHFADGGLIPELIASHPVTAPESVYAALAHNPETTASAPSAAPKNAGPLSDDAMFKTYMVHQQGSAGAKALFQSAESGKS